MLILVYTSHRSCLYQSLVSRLYLAKLSHTSGLVVGSASWAYTPVEQLREGREHGLHGCEGSWLGFSFCLAGVCDIQHRGWP